MTIKMSHIKKTVLLSVALPLMIGLSGAYADDDVDAVAADANKGMDAVACEKIGGTWTQAISVDGAESTHAGTCTPPAQ